MASHALALYNSSSSPYNFDGALSFTLEDLEREATPLAILPPLSNGSSGGDSLKSTGRSRPPLHGAKIKPAPRRPTTGVLGLKKTVGGPNKCPMPTSSDNTSSRESLSHILVGVDLPNGGRGKGFMRKPAKAPAPKTVGTSSGAPLKIPRQNQRKAPDVFQSGSESKEPQPPCPPLSFLAGA